MHSPYSSSPEEAVDLVPQSVVVAAVDGSDESLAALAWAHANATQTGALLRVVSAYAQPHAASDSAGAYLVQYQSARIAAEDQLMAAVRSVACAGVGDVQVVAQPGSIEQLLIDQSREATMIVLGTRRTDGWTSKLRGSLTNRLTGKVAIPVVSVPLATGDREPVAV